MFLLFGGLFVAGIITTISTAAQLDEVSRIGLLFWAVSGLFELLIVVWLWSMGSFLSSIVHPDLRLNARFFQLTSNLSVALRACVHDFSSTMTIFGICSRNPATPIRDVLYVLQIYFVSKSLVLAETGRPALFYDYAGPFFLVWFFPIGVWIVQPRINRLYERKLAEPSDEAGSRGRAERLRIGRSEIAYVNSATHQLRIAGTLARFLTNHLGGSPTRPRTR